MQSKIENGERFIKIKGKWINGEDYIKMTNEKEIKRDITEDTIYGINVEQQAKIYDILKALKIKTRKHQNINFVTIKVEVQYF